MLIAAAHRQPIQPQKNREKTMKKSASLSCLLLATALWPAPTAWAQETSVLHVVKSTVNAESENAELCLEFDKTLAAASPSRLSTALRLEADGKSVTPANIVAAGTSLCLFPLERGKSYRLDVNGLRGADDEKMTSPYQSSFTIPDRSPALAFTGKNGGVNEFGDYDRPLTLRAVNVAHAKINVYRLTDAALMTRAWQDRAQTALAPSESAFLARSKGQTVWREEDSFEAAPNATVSQEISLRDKIPDLAPGLYLIVADAGKDEGKPANKGLSPLAAAWFTKSDFSLRALRDGDGIHVFASSAAAGKIKNGLRLQAFDKKPEQLAEASIGANGIGLIPPPPKLADKAADRSDAASIVGTDAAGNVAFADIESLPPLSGNPALGDIHTTALFTPPFGPTDVSLSLTPSEDASALASPSLLRLSQGDFIYADFPVPPLAAETAKLSIPVPAAQGAWSLRWQKADGAVLADAPLRITAHADAPRLEVASERDTLTGDAPWSVTIQSRLSSGKPAPLTGGRILLSWQKLDPAAFGWKDYRFGTPALLGDTPAHIADFLTDLNGQASLRLTVPKPPQERGLYQAVLKVVAEPDSGIADATPLILPLRPEGTVIGLKPLAQDARFTQNGLARFVVVGLSSDGKPRDVSGLSYQVYEEGRSFAWYQDEGKWNYKPEAQLRPIGGGALTVKADASSILEWPVTAGNYRLAILDPNGKILAQTTFSAGWDSTGASASPVLPLNVGLPKTLQPGHEVLAHVTLPEPAMLTAIVADTRLRHVVHEFRPKGDTVIAFTPASDWLKTVSLTIEAAPQDAQKTGSAMRRAVIEASVAQGKPPVAQTAPASITATEDPSAFAVRKNGVEVLTFGIQNNSDTRETYHYAFTASPGLKIESGENGDVTLDGKQSRSLSLTVSGGATGNKDLRLEITGSHTPRLSRTWAMAVLPKTDSWRSAETASIDEGQPLLPVVAKPHEGAVAFVSRTPMNGVAEILSFVVNARPFTTEELGASIEALRLWHDTLVQTGLAPDFWIAARMQEQVAQLLRHQNPDGGFAPYRGGESAMNDTAAALTALGADMSEQAKPAKTLAIGWLKQRLANTWLDEKERAPRAAAYAALAAADAIEPASLHYFSDTSALGTLPPIAKANIAAAFKHIRDPDAAAFWVKKMLDEDRGPKAIPLLNALSATDALSSDDVLAATSAMAQTLRHATSPNLLDAASLLRTIAANAANAGKWKVANGKETREISGVLTLRAGDPLFAAYRNSDTRPLSVTWVSEDEAPSPSSALPRGASLARHVYRLNGVELSPSAKPVRGEIYMVELKGTSSAASEDAPLLLQEGGNGVRPMGCPLSAKLDTLSFIPWFTTRSLTPLRACEFSPHALNVVLTPPENDNVSFSVVTFAHIDAPSVAEIPLPTLRVLK